MLCACGEDIEVEEERLVFDPFDARIDGICYLLSTDAKTAVVTTGDTFYRDDVVIPETVVYEGVTYRVMAIASEAFSGCRNLRSVRISDGVAVIGESAFLECSSLETIVLPASLLSVPSRMCRGCYALRKADLPSRVRSIGFEAFSNCTAMTSVTLPDGLEEIGADAFFCCTSLTSLRLPASVRSLGWQAGGSDTDSFRVLRPLFAFVGYQHP